MGWCHVVGAAVGGWVLGRYQKGAERRKAGAEGAGTDDLLESVGTDRRPTRVSIPACSYCVYLFHELPPSVREAAAREMARVLKPGGVAILTDSAQLGDRDSFDPTLGNFGDFQEPFYRSYISTPLGPLFEAAGLQCGMKVGVGGWECCVCACEG